MQVYARNEVAIFKKRFLNLYLLMYIAITAKNIRPIDPKANHIFNIPRLTLKALLLYHSLMM